jgi:hypothetical protein
MMIAAVKAARQKNAMDAPCLLPKLSSGAGAEFFVFGLAAVFAGALAPVCFPAAAVFGAVFAAGFFGISGSLALFDFAEPADVFFLGVFAN